MNAYEIVTEAIINELRKGVVPWRKPWIVNDAAAVNYVSRKPYSLLNRLLLSRSGEYLTENQMLSLGGRFRSSGLSEDALDAWARQRYSERQIRSWWNGLSLDEKDQKHQSSALRETVTFYKPVTARDEQDTDTVERSYPVLRFYSVYHISDIEGISSRDDAASESFSTSLPDPSRVVDDYVTGTGVRIVTGQVAPSYSDSDDTVSVPSSSCFSSEEARLSTLFHYLVHSTGRDDRLARHLPDTQEELTAEIGSSMICTALCLDTQDVWENQASYIGAWIGELEQDSHLITRAASSAEKAADFILNGGRLS